MIDKKKKVCYYKVKVIPILKYLLNHHVGIPLFLDEIFEQYNEEFVT